MIHQSFANVSRAELVTRLRAWLATQPNTPSDAKNVGAALVDSEKQTITPEQAVAVLVANGAEKRRILTTSGNGDKEWVDALILPTATPERGT
jgi:hypothetical protein